MRFSSPYASAPTARDRTRIDLRTEPCSRLVRARLDDLTERGAVPLLGELLEVEELAASHDQVADRE